MRLRPPRRCKFFRLRKIGCNYSLRCGLSFLLAPRQTFKKLFETRFFPFPWSARHYEKVSADFLKQLNLLQKGKYASRNCFRPAQIRI